MTATPPTPIIRCSGHARSRRATPASATASARRRESPRHGAWPIHRVAEGAA